MLGFSSVASRFKIGIGSDVIGNKNGGLESHLGLTAVKPQTAWLKATTADNRPTLFAEWAVMQLGT
jgi:hypothetical protein